MSIGELFVTNLTSQPLIWKKYKKGLPEDCPGIFCRKARKLTTGSLLPHWKEAGISFYNIRRQNLYFVACTSNEVMPVFVIELLTRIYHLMKDFCGVVNETSLHSNMVLIYEILDEVMDSGVIQVASTAKLKPYIQSEPVPTSAVPQSPETIAPNLFGIGRNVLPSNAADKPVMRSKWDKELRKNEIFLDVIERMSVQIGANGNTLHSEVSGQVNMKSFLVGCPHIKMGLNEDLTIGVNGKERGYGNNAHMDEVSFHECVQLDQFNDSRLLTISPPEGEQLAEEGIQMDSESFDFHHSNFAVMTYKIHGDLPHGLPFRLQSHIAESTSSRDLEVSLRLRCDISSSMHAVNVTVTLPVPQTVTSMSQQLSEPGQVAEFQPDKKRLTWTIKKLYGKSEATAFFKLIVVGDNPANRLELGPIALEFEISGFVSSNLQIRFLRVFDTENSYVPLRWARYLSVTDSYLIKL